MFTVSVVADADVVSEENAEDSATVEVLLDVDELPLRAAACLTLPDFKACCRLIDFRPSM
jgi:hypothetical protein